MNEIIPHPSDYIILGVVIGMFLSTLFRTVELWAKNWIKQNDMKLTQAFMVDLGEMEARVMATKLSAAMKHSGVNLMDGVPYKGDLYKKLAAKRTGKKIEDITPEERAEAKTAALRNPELLDEFLKH